MLGAISMVVLTASMLFFSYYLNRKEVISPSVICCGMYVLSTLLLVLYAQKWEFKMEIVTLVYILMALVAVCIGEQLAKKFKITKRKNHSAIRNETGVITYSKFIQFMLFCFVCLTAILYLYELKNLVASSSISGAAYSFLMQARWTMIVDNVSIASYVQFMLTASEAIACIYTYIFLHNLILSKKFDKNILFLGIDIVYIIASFMTTGRSKMLNFCIYIIILFVLLTAKRKNWNYNRNIKIFSKIFLVCVVAIALFYIAGTLTEKTSNYDNLMDNFANYFSSSIYAFNEYVKDPSSFSSANSFFGCYTLSGVHSFLRGLGFDIPDNIIALEYIKCGGYNTNIYTPIRRYIQDFGAIGMMLNMMFLGFFYEKLLMKCKNNNVTPLTFIFTAYFFFPLFFISIEERFFMDVILTRSLHTIVFMYLIYIVVIKQTFKLGIKR